MEVIKELFENIKRRPVIKELFENIKRRPATILYPSSTGKSVEGVRTKVTWDMSKCIGCSLCEKVCPGFAIKMVGKGKRAEIAYSVARCIFCGECIEVCPTRAIQDASDIKFVYSNKEDMTIEFRRKDDDLEESVV